MKDDDFFNSQSKELNAGLLYYSEETVDNHSIPLFSSNL